MRRVDNRRNEPPIILVKWYDVGKWLLERVESFPKNQRFVFGQRLADRGKSGAVVTGLACDPPWSDEGPEYRRMSVRGTLGRDDRVRRRRPGQRVITGHALARVVTASAEALYTVLRGWRGR